MSIYVLEIDDAEKTDILTLLPSTTAWIREALAGGTGSSRETDIGTAPPTNPGGVFVHCQAGMSRSATVVAAYLMRELNLDPVDAVSFLRERRPVVDPSPTFWHQLGLYYQADGRVNLKDRSTRQWYLERTTGQVMSESDWCIGGPGAEITMTSPRRHQPPHMKVADEILSPPHFTFRIIPQCHNQQTRAHDQVPSIWRDTPLRRPLRSHLPRQAVLDGARSGAKCAVDTWP